MLNSLSCSSTYISFIYCVFGLSCILMCPFFLQNYFNLLIVYQFVTYFYMYYNFVFKVQVGLCFGFSCILMCCFFLHKCFILLTSLLIFMPPRRTVGGHINLPLSVRLSIRIQIHGLFGYLLLQFWSYSFNILQDVYTHNGGVHVHRILIFSLLRQTRSYFQRCEIFLSCTSARQKNHVRFTGKCMLYSLCQLPTHPPPILHAFPF